MKNWKQFNEDLNEQPNVDAEKPSEDEINSDQEFKDAIVEIVQKSVNSTEESVISEFIDSYLKDPETTNIEGLINDSDVWDFYVKWTSEIDEVLNGIKWFDEIPSENNTYGVYDYVVKSTRRAVKEAISDIKEEKSKTQ
jgi:hypothetical protein